jgi:hypothetical protein
MVKSKLLLVKPQVLLGKSVMFVGWLNPHGNARAMPIVGA